MKSCEKLQNPEQGSSGEESNLNVTGKTS